MRASAIFGRGSRRLTAKDSSDRERGIVEEAEVVADVGHGNGTAPAGGWREIARGGVPEEDWPANREGHRAPSAGCPRAASCPPSSRSMAMRAVRAGGSRSTAPRLAPGRRGAAHGTANGAERCVGPGEGAGSRRPGSDLPAAGLRPAAERQGPNPRAQAKGARRAREWRRAAAGPRGRRDPTACRRAPTYPEHVHEVDPRCLWCCRSFRRPHGRRVPRGDAQLLVRRVASIPSSPGMDLHRPDLLADSIGAAREVAVFGIWVTLHLLLGRRRHRERASAFVLLGFARVVLISPCRTP